MGEFILIYTIICAITFAFIVLNKYINNKSKFILAKKIIAEKDIHNSDPEQMFNLLDYLIQTEMSYLIELPFEGRDIKRITNFEDSLIELTSAVTADISELFIERAKQLGITESFIYDYITKRCTIKLLEYMRNNNGGIQKNEEEE